MKAATTYVRSNERKRVTRPQPPMGDRRIKRVRTRSAQKRAALREA